MNFEWVRRYVVNLPVISIFLLLTISPIFFVFKQLLSGTLFGLFYQIVFAPYWILSYSIPTLVKANIYHATGVDISISVFHLLLAIGIGYLLRKAAEVIDVDNGEATSIDIQY